MALSRDLLEQAHFLARREAGKPKQASLRRAVSTAYYAVFHLLVSEAAAQACSSSREELRMQVQRAFKHTTMKEAAKLFMGVNLPKYLDKIVQKPLETDLVEVAKGFVSLQEQRHKADYDLSDPFDRSRVLGILQQADNVFRSWNAVRNAENAKVFLSALIFHGQWSK